MPPAGGCLMRRGHTRAVAPRDSRRLGVCRPRLPSLIQAPTSLDHHCHGVDQLSTWPPPPSALSERIHSPKRGFSISHTRC